MKTMSEANKPKKINSKKAIKNQKKKLKQPTKNNKNNVHANENLNLKSFAISEKSIKMLNLNANCSRI